METHEQRNSQALLYHVPKGLVAQLLVSPGRDRGHDNMSTLRARPPLSGLLMNYRDMGATDILNVQKTSQKDGSKDGKKPEKWK